MRSWRKLYDIDTLPRWERNIVPPIEGPLESLLVGSMLGDGRLVRQTNATYFTEGHCLAQKPYLEWKATQWGPWANPIRDISGKGPYPTVGFTTCAHANLNEWQEPFYADKRKGWKRLLPQIVDKVDAYALAVWYMDDGSLLPDGSPRISFGGGPVSLRRALAALRALGLSPKVYGEGTRQAIHFPKQTVEFASLVGRYLHETLQYKLPRVSPWGPDVWGTRTPAS